MACSRWSFRKSFFSLLDFIRSSLLTTPTARWYFTTRRARLRVVSVAIPFLCLRRYSTVQAIL